MGSRPGPVLALLAVVPWLGLIRHDVRPEGPVSGGIAFRRVGTAPLAWWLALFFGLQSLQAYAVFGWLPQVYRAAGVSAQTAGLLLGVATAAAIPISLVLPGMAARRPNQTPFVLALCGCYLVGYAGLILWPAGGAWAWALLIGIGTGLFPIALTLIGLRSKTSDGTAALSGFAQSVGYLLAAIGPLMMGAVFGVTGSWTVPLCVLAVLVVPWPTSEYARRRRASSRTRCPDPRDGEEARREVLVWPLGGGARRDRGGAGAWSPDRIRPGRTPPSPAHWG